MTVLIAGTDAQGGDLERVVETLAADHEVRRAETLDAVRAALPECTVVVVARLPSEPHTAVRETVRSGVYCDPTTPVVRLGSPGSRAGASPDFAADGYDGVVPVDSPESLVEVLRAIEQTDSYRDAVEDLYEACKANARGDDVDGARIAAAFERADRAFADLPELAEWTPYQRVFVDAERESGEQSDDETE